MNESRQCADCGNNFIPRPQKFRKQIYCDTCGRLTSRRHRRKIGLKPWIAKVCPACQQEFKTKYKVHHTCCSSKCRYYWGRITNFYKLTRETYKALLDRANGLCEICGYRAVLNIDHCHRTGKVRGLLCRYCNQQLGYYEGLTPEKIGQIQVYLNRASQ